MRAGEHVRITRGALLGEWGQLGREHPDLPGCWFVRLRASDHPADRRLLAAGQLTVFHPILS